MKWISVSEQLPSHHCMVKVRTVNDDEMTAYFYTDKIQWIADYGKKPSYFWDEKTKKPIDHLVTHWRKTLLGQSQEGHKENFTIRSSHHMYEKYNCPPPIRSYEAKIKMTNDNFVCKEKASRDADDDDIVCALPNPWIQWAKLGARVQKHNDYILKKHTEIMDMIVQNKDDEMKKIVMRDLIETIHLSYAVLFEDVITNGVAPDDS